MRASYERANALFGSWGPFRGVVWEEQFDGIDVLDELAQCPWPAVVQIPLSYYLDDLKYVEPLQSEVFRYLFPVCLTVSHLAIVDSKEPSGYLEPEVMDAIAQGGWRKMATPEQEAGTYEFLADSLLDRLDLVRGMSQGLQVEPEPFDHPYHWLWRLNALGTILPDVGLVWDEWWSMRSPGFAVAAAKYTWGLMRSDSPGEVAYPESPQGSDYWQSSLNPDPGWRPENVRFLRDRLSVDYLIGRMDEAAQVLRGQPEEPVVRAVLDELPRFAWVVERRITELLDLLSDREADARSSFGWMSDREIDGSKWES